MTLRGDRSQVLADVIRMKSTTPYGQSLAVVHCRAGSMKAVHLCLNGQFSRTTPRGPPHAQRPLLNHHDSQRVDLPS